MCISVYKAKLIASILPKEVKHKWQKSKEKHITPILPMGSGRSVLQHRELCQEGFGCLCNALVSLRKLNWPNLGTQILKMNRCTPETRSDSV